MKEKKPIRVLHVLYGMDLAGAETLLMNLYRNIDREIIQFDFAVCAGRECAYDEEILSMGGKLISYPRYNGKNHIAYVKWWNSFFEGDEEHQIVHGHIGSTAAIYLSIAKKYGRYTIAHSHSTYKGHYQVKDLLYRVYAFPTRYIADCFMGCSKTALIERFGKKRVGENAFILNNAIDAQKFSYNKTFREQVRKEYGFSNDLLILGTVGRLTRPKNPDGILSIIAELKKREVDFKFLWIGTGELEESIKKKIKDLELEEQIIMAGARFDIHRVLQAMDIFVLPSLWEGLSVASVEAQAAGLPVLCSDTVTKETKITEGCIFLPLNDTNCWVEEIIRNKSYYRRDCYEEIKAAKYDMKENVRWLENFYCSKENRIRM